MSDELAKAMYEAASAVAFVGGIGIEEQWECVDQDERDLCEAHANAAREYYGLTGSAERGAVGKAVGAVYVWCREHCDTMNMRCNECPVRVALGALGEDLKREMGEGN